MLTLVLHALNALFLSERLSEATSLYKRLSSTPKHVLTLQKNELLNDLAEKCLLLYLPLKTESKYSSKIYACIQLCPVLLCSLLFTFSVVLIPWE